jgi:phage shock protein A
LKAKADVAVDRLADPRETPDYTHQRQVDLLAKVRAEQAKVCGDQAEERRLNAAAERLETMIEVRRARKEAIKATEVQRRVDEIWSSISEEMANAGMAAIPDHRRREMLTQLLDTIKEMAATRERLDQQIDTLGQQQAALDCRASQSLDIGRADRAREASARKAEIERLLSDLAAHRRGLQQFTTAYEQLAAKVS